MADGLSSYSWQDKNPQDVLQAMYSGQPLAVALTGQANIGAQSMQQVNQYVQQVLLPAFQQQYAEKANQIIATNPAFDPKKYLVDWSQIYNPGEGASANRAAITNKAEYQIKSYQQALKTAQAAVDKYIKTGVVEPYPSIEQLADATYRAVTNNAYGGLNPQAIPHVKDVIGGKISEEDKAVANAAAARVGSPLPYPDGGIGQIGAGGVFQTPEQAQQAYTNGQLNTVGQNIVNSNSAGNMKDGVNQATVNADGSVSWNGQTFPNKDAAALAANSVGVTSLRFGGIAIGGTTGTSGGTTGATSSTAGGTAGGTIGASGAVATGTGASAAGAAGFAVDPQAQAQAMSILNQYLNDGTIDNGTYQMFKKAVELWDPSQQVDYANILNTFETIKQTDINPYFQEQAALFTNELEANRDYIIQSKVLENTQQQQDVRKLKENMQSDLAARGMLFTGESVKQLGDQGIFAVEGTPQAQQSAIPTVAAYANGEFQQQTQAAASASNLRYEKSLQDLQRQAESYLGTTGSAGMVPGTSQIGGITGSLTEQKKAAQASTLTGLYNQQSNNVQAQSGQESQIFNEV